MANSKEWDKMLRGELYMPWDEDLQANRTRCQNACEKFNAARNIPRRRKVELWRKYVLPVADMIVLNEAALTINFL